jgi:hypothetical protein
LALFGDLWRCSAAVGALFVFIGVSWLGLASFGEARLGFGVASALSGVALRFLSFL